MNYDQAIDWLFGQLPMYQRAGRSALNPGLHNIKLLDHRLKHPHTVYPIIHVAGTNGKGSTCHILSSILQEAGYKVGLHTSPHLKDYRERIKINVAMVSKNFVVDFISKHHNFLQENRLSFFETGVGMALEYFKEQQVDIAIIEVGLGGRLDSTNIIVPAVSVITSIGIDHVAVLGNTLSKIAHEKAGIIKSKVPVVIGERRAHLRSRFRDSADSISAPYHQVDHRHKAPVSDLLGNYQKDNLRTALKSIEVLTDSSSLSVSDNNISDGCLNVGRNTGLMGRFQKLSDSPLIIADVAHNAAGLKNVFDQISTIDYRNLYVVMGMVSDKDINSILHLFPRNAEYHISTPNVPRGMDVEILANRLKPTISNIYTYSTIPEAFRSARMTASENDLILVTGSVFTVAEII